MRSETARVAVALFSIPSRVVGPLSLLLNAPGAKPEPSKLIRLIATSSYVAGRTLPASARYTPKRACTLRIWRTRLNWEGEPWAKQATPKVDVTTNGPFAIGRSIQ